MTRAGKMRGEYLRYDEVVVDETGRRVALIDMLLLVEARKLLQQFTIRPGLINEEAAEQIQRVHGLYPLQEM